MRCKNGEMFVVGGRRDGQPCTPYNRPASPDTNDGGLCRSHMAAMRRAMAQAERRYLARWLARVDRSGRTT